MAREYREEIDRKNMNTCYELLEKMPEFMKSYVFSLERSVATNTLRAYMQRIMVFFTYLVKNNENFTDLKNITINQLDQLKKNDIELFCSAVYHGKMNDLSKKNKTEGTTVDNYLSALNSLWNFFLDEELVEKNPCARIKRSKKTKNKEVIALDKNEQELLINCSTSGCGLSKQQLAFRTITAYRDSCIIVLFLRTGMRVSELAGIDIDDISLEEKKIKILRKGDKMSNIYLDEMTLNYLTEYLEVRNDFKPCDDERALFLVSIGKYKGQRLTPRSIENIVKKYVRAGVPAADSKVSCHKLRSSFASLLIEETDNLELARQALDHEDPRTVMKYYKQTDKRKKDYFINRN